MNKEILREYCLSLPAVSEDVKWGNDLCFLIGEKMFCVTTLEGDFGVSLKVTADEMDALCSRNDIEPAKYLARYHWISIKDEAALSPEEWQNKIKASYQLVFSKLPKKTQKQLVEN